MDRLVASASNSSRKMMQPSGNCSHVLSMSAHGKGSRVFGFGAWGLLASSCSV